uniref:M13 family peptidase n=1 Tax=Parascaris univalens TaxID=6257 RepID=A0A915BWX3_PARUN
MNISENPSISEWASRLRLNYTSMRKHAFGRCLEMTTLMLCLTTFTLAAASPKPSLTPSLPGTDKPKGKANTVEIGLSPGFLKVSKHLLSSINSKVDPCEDFFQFACGRWVHENEIPKDLSSYGHFAKLREKVSAEMKRLFESKEKSPSKAINNIRQIYQGCMDVERINKQRGMELLEAIKEMGYWPIIHADLWRPEHFDLTDLLISVGVSRAVDVFVDVYVSPDQRNVSRRMIHIDQGSLGLGASSRDYYLNVTRYAKQVIAYHNYITQKILLIAEDAGRPTKVADIVDQIDEIVEFEKALAEIMISEDQRRNYTKLYNVHKLSELGNLLPVVDWDRYFRALMPFDLHSYLDADPDIIVNEVDFLKRLATLLEATESRIIANYIIWRYTSAWSFQLGARYDDAQQEFLRMLIGKRAKSPRWKDCSSAASGRMSYAAGALYVRAHFNKADKSVALAMIDDLHTAFREMVRNSDWMDNRTKHIAIEKSKAMQSLIGYPDFIYSDKELDDYYKELKLEPGETYASMVQKTSRWAQQRSFRRLLEPVDRSEFGISSSTVNAFYSSLKNGITFPAAILQAPLFDRSFPKAVNYGAIGSVIGHEITHGFDDQGSQFDKEGNLADWWDNVTSKRFTERTKCIIEQYNGYSVPGTGLHINGRLTLGENIADNGGIKEAYHAYKRYVEKLGHEEKRLPGLEQYTNDQIFFISYAQTWCGHSKPEATIRQLLTDPHAPLRFRVNGVVVNQPEFANAFHCPVGSPMNPEKRCVVW